MFLQVKEPTTVQQTYLPYILSKERPLQLPTHPLWHEGTSCRVALQAMYACTGEEVPVWQKFVIGRSVPQKWTQLPAIQLVFILRPAKIQAAPAAP